MDDSRRELRKRELSSEGVGLCHPTQRETCWLSTRGNTFVAPVNAALVNLFPPCFKKFKDTGSLAAWQDAFSCVLGKQVSFILVAIAVTWFLASAGV